MNMLKNFVAIVLTMLLSISAQADVPKLINYQGRLTNTAGVPVANATYTVTFTIYDAPTGGTNYWTEDQSVTTSDGLFTVHLGAVNSLADSVFSSSTRYLGIKVNPNAEFSPRDRIVSTGYSYRVGSVDGASGGTITSKVTIGTTNINTGIDAFVSGYINTVSGNYSSVGGGINNSASGDVSTVGGGQDNATIGYHATIAGGTLNNATGFNSTIGGGYENIASGALASVGGGYQNTASEEAATVSGGEGNTSSGLFATVGGGRTNTASADNVTIGGGAGNLANFEYATVGGGIDNKASGAAATIGGGHLNTASQEAATVSGGRSNIASGPFAIIGGGEGNTASLDYATVGGGHLNTASGQRATVGGGEGNTASGFAATIPGGSGCSAVGNFSVAAGRQGKALHDGAFVWGDGADAPFSSTASNQFLIRASGGVGIGTASPQGALHLYSSANPTVMRIQSDGAPGLGRIEFVSNPQGSAFEWRPGYIQSTDNGGFTGGLAFFTNGSGPLFGGVEAMRIVNGNVGIGTTSPTSYAGGRVLHINNPGGRSILRLGDDEPLGIQWEMSSLVFGGNGMLNFSNIDSLTNPLTILANGNIGMNNVGPAHPLHMASGAHVTAGGVWTNASSRELKTDIEPLKNEEYSDILEKLEDLEVVHFKYKSEPDVAHIGMIAEDVPAEIASPDRKGIPTADAIAFLVAAVKAQQDVIVKLEKRLKEVEKK